MRNEFTAIVERDGEWYIAHCAEVPGANGQGRTRSECLDSLSEAIALILEHQREGRAHTLYTNPNTGKMEAVPRYAEIPDKLARKICRGRSVPEAGR